jgi:hypothetical protein
MTETLKRGAAEAVAPFAPPVPRDAGQTVVVVEDNLGVRCVGARTRAAGSASPNGKRIWLPRCALPLMSDGAVAATLAGRDGDHSDH